MEVMTKKITSLNVDDKFWVKWTMYVHKKTGSTYKVSEETQKALEKYMKDFPIE
jgi:hypothetical protein